MAEGDTILRVARRLDRYLAGQALAVGAPSPRGRALGLKRLDGIVLEAVEARGKNLLLDFGELSLHSHLGMAGTWQVLDRGQRWRRPAAAAWALLRGERAEAVQFGGPTLRVLPTARLRRELARLGPDVLAPAFDLGAAVRSLRGAGDRGIGEALLDQGLLAGIGNIFKSEACFAAGVDPWARIDRLGDERLAAVASAARRLMLEAVERGRAESAVYRRAGRPCPSCGAPIASRGQGDANRVTYWCPRCQGQ